MKNQCAWKGCPETYSDPIPRSWSCLVMGRRKLRDKPFSARAAALAGALDFYRDAVLCPDHAKVLDEQLRLIRPRISRKYGNLIIDGTVSIQSALDDNTIIDKPSLDFTDIKAQLDRIEQTMWQLKLRNWRY